jgi:hypothetical protein
MLSSLVPLVVVVCVLFWVVLPALILLVVAVGPRREPVHPVWVRHCRGSHPTRPCWVTGKEEYCPKHEGPRLRSGGPDLEIFIG